MGLGLSAMVPGGPQAASAGSLPREGCSFLGTKPQAVPLVLLEVPRRPRLDLYPGKGARSWVPRLQRCPWFSWRSPGDVGWISTQGRELIPGYRGSIGAPGSWRSGGTWAVSHGPWRSPGGLGWIFTQGRVLIPGYQASGCAPGSPGGPQAASAGSLPRERSSFLGTKAQAVPLVLLEVPRRPRLDLYPGKGARSWVPRPQRCPWFSWRSPGDLGWISTQGRELGGGGGGGGGGCLSVGPQGSPGVPGGFLPGGEGAVRGSLEASAGAPVGPGGEPGA